MLTVWTFWAHRLPQWTTQRAQLTFYAVLNDKSNMRQTGKQTDRHTDMRTDRAANCRVSRKIIMLNLTGNSTQGHWRMRPRRRQFVDDGVADCWLNWWRRRRTMGTGTGQWGLARSALASPEDNVARRLSRILFWHKFQLLAFSSNLKQIKFCAAVDYWLPIVVVEERHLSVAGGSVPAMCI